MNMLRVVLAVQSREYIEPLLDYLHGSEYAKRIRVTAFTQPDAFCQYMREPADGKQPDAVIGEAVFFESWTPRDEPRVICFLLSEEGRSEGSVIPLLKYQPVPHLLASVWDECRRRSDGDLRISSREETMIIGFVSASGGTGKTTAALNMAKQLGGAGYSVFYLNLETADSSSLFTPSVEGMTGLSRLLYDMKTRGPHDMGAAGTYGMRQHAFKADTFQPLANRKEISEMTSAEACELINVLARNSQYDAIIVDADAELNARTEAVLKTSSRLVWLLSDDLISMHKCRLRLNELHSSHKDDYDSVMDKTLFVLNRCAGQQVNELPGEGMVLHGVLPHIPSWKQMDREELMLSSPIFQREIRKLCRELLSEDAFTFEEPVRA